MKTSLLIAGSLALVPMTYAQDKPNIIIILADDLGFSDLGCFGGEIHTPVLDKLAKNGVRMTQMYNSARSCPSRANLLTGLYPHQTGLGHMDGSHPAWPKGYSGFRSNSDNVTIAEVLSSRARIVSAGWPRFSQPKVISLVVSTLKNWERGFWNTLPTIFAVS